MKKRTVKPASKKPAAKKPAAKKPSSSRPKRKAGSSELTQVVERLDAIMDKLNELLERVAQLTAPPANPAIEPMHQPPDEHADDVDADLTPIGEGEEQDQ